MLDMTTAKLVKKAFEKNAYGEDLSLNDILHMDLIHNVGHIGYNILATQIGDVTILVNVYVDNETGNLCIGRIRTMAW